MVTRTLTLAEVARLPAVTDLVTSGQALGLGRTKAYELARAGQFPCPVIRAGKTWLVPTAGLLALLGLPALGTGHPDGDHGDPSAPGAATVTAGASGSRTPARTRPPHPRAHPPHGHTHPACGEICGLATPARQA